MSWQSILGGYKRKLVPFISIHCYNQYNKQQKLFCHMMSLKQDLDYYGNNNQYIFSFHYTRKTASPFCDLYKNGCISSYPAKHELIKFEKQCNFRSVCSYLNMPDQDFNICCLVLIMVYNYPNRMSLGNSYDVSLWYIKTSQQQH